MKYGWTAILMLWGGSCVAQYRPAPVADSAKRVSVADFNHLFRDRDLPFFCRQELLLEQKTHLPVKFRVGGAEYSDYLEQKPGSALPPALK